MAITDLQISDTLETSAPSIKYTGNEGPQNPQQGQQQQEMQIAQQIWEALGPEQQGQFQSFEQFFQSGIWKQILQQMPMPNRMGAEYGGRIGFQQGLGTSLHGDDESALMKKVQFLMEVLGLSQEEALQRATSQFNG